MPSPSTLPLSSSLLSRLGCHEPELRDGTLARLREDIRRNLEQLLNTRQRVGAAHHGDLQHHRGLIDYGIDDAAFADVGTPHGQQTLLHRIERQIAQFEPRLQHARVLNATVTNGILQFRIEATLALRTDAVTFDSQLDPLRKSLTIAGTR